MGIFRRRKKKQDASASQISVPGVPAAAAATGDFDVVVRELIKQMGPPGEELIELGNDTVKIGKSENYLGNLRKGWEQRDAPDREIWLRNAIHGFFLSQLMDRAELDLSMLRPGIRSQWYLNQMPLMMKARGTDTEVQGPASKPLGPGLARVLIWDTPTTMSLITQAQIADWNADFDTLWGAAVTNLAADPYEQGWTVAVAKAAAESKVSGEGRVWSPLQADDYSAERMFMNGYLDNVEMSGEVVMFHPTRAALFLADPDDVIGIAVAAQMAAAKVGDANPVTFIPYIGRGTSWRPLELPEGHPASQAVARLRLTELNDSYAQQKEFLSQIHGEDLFVAKLSAFEKDGAITTITSWTQGAVSLLPRADLVSFVVNPLGESEVIMVDWNAASRIVGTKLMPTDHWPERWHVTSFPDADELAQLRAEQQR